jgi:hypothetical protein
MQNQSNILIIPAILAWILLAGYYFYRSWFDTTGLEDSMKRDVDRTPTWYPIRNYSRSKIGTKYWLWQIRILSTLGILVGILVLILVVYVFTR